MRFLLQEVASGFVLATIFDRDRSGGDMKKLAMMFIAISTLLSGCVVYDTPHRDSGMHRGDREHDRDRGRDSDRDGVPDRQDRRPNDRDRY